MPVTRAQLRRLIHAIGVARPPAARDRAPEARALRDLRRRTSPWWDPKNVVGLCVARKMQGGKPGKIGFQVLVRSKRPERALARRERIPKELSAHELGIRDPVITDVREVGEGRLESLVSMTRPESPGFNVGGERTGSGTFACTVRARSTGTRLGLSCGHVIAGFGQASPGDTVLMPSFEMSSEIDFPVSPIGKLVTVLPIGFADGDGARNIDAATFEPDLQADLEDRLAILNRQPSGIRSSPPLDLHVHKVGSTTEHTTGVVHALHVLVALPYPKPSGGMGEALFDDLIGVSRFTEAGDSGALVLDDDDKAIGLHLGGFKAMSVCIPIKRVLDAVGCDLITAS